METINETMDIVVDNIIRLRKFKKITQIEMASILGIKQNNYSQIETKRVTMSLDKLLKIADFLEVEPTLLFKPLKFEVIIKN